MSGTLHPLRGTLLDDPAPPLFDGTDSMPLAMALKLRHAFSTIGPNNDPDSIETAPLASIEEHFKNSITLALIQGGFGLPEGDIIPWQKLYRDPILQPIAIEVAQALFMQMQDLAITPDCLTELQTEKLAAALGCPRLTPSTEIQAPTQSQVIDLATIRRT